MKNTFDNVIGYEGIKAELMQIVDMVKNPEKYKVLGASIPKGVLIYGDPGLGKTLMAEALIHETGLRCSTVKRTNRNSNMMESIMNAFHYAQKETPHIVFLDDLDKFANEDERHCNAEEYVTVQACINEVKDKDVLVVATVNDMNLLPDSLSRSGRFDRKIHVLPPTNEEAMEIIRHYIKGKPLADDVDVQDIVKMVNTQSCAVLETTLNEAAIYAGWENCDCIFMRHIVEAVQRLQYNAPADFTTGDSSELELHSFHEAAHLVVAESLQPDCIGFVSIRCKGKNRKNGFTHLCESIDRRPHHIMIALAGKVASEMRYSGFASGCQDDLEKATAAILDGIVNSATGGYSLLEPGSWSTSNLRDARVEATLAAEMERYEMLVRDILIRNGQLLDKVAAELKEKKYLLYSDIQRIKSEYGIELTYVV